MKKIVMCMAMMLLLGVVGCREGQEAAVMSSGDVEIPSEILGSLDPVTRKDLTVEPKYLALTFDDGPRNGTTDVLLDGLLERGVVATFFVIGEQVEGSETILQRMKDEGHQIGNHTYSHTRLLSAEKDTVIEEIRKTEVVLQNLLGEGEYWLRPPYGLIDSERAKLVDTPMIHWSLDPEDWKLLDAEKIVACVMEQVNPGDIILLHDFYPSSVEAALELVDRLQSEGYTFVTVEELFCIYGVIPEAGAMYAQPRSIRSMS